MWIIIINNYYNLNFIYSLIISKLFIYFYFLKLQVSYAAAQYFLQKLYLSIWLYNNNNNNDIYYTG